MSSGGTAPGAYDHAAMLGAVMPVLLTARLRLRAPRLSDFEAWHIVTGGSRDAAHARFGSMLAGWSLDGTGYWVAERRQGGGIAGFVPVAAESEGPGPVRLMRPAAERAGLGEEASIAAADHARALTGPRNYVSYLDTAILRSARRAGAAALPSGRRA
ncbi:GNAT family N-acetyltransferase [Roseicyclus sp. F158]|uniref:GNAT family N-acetyltransferase n=1 Tax=Tropicimonas omnivorans TaxID=3075590 RepID=A0ABU3DD87_9RHOB|nr:GNAT family N-acetyltransferase [Roseicyclus sp. F158]MDT0681117.1 GNAT family N-acetyltransferase [Roseicyclus sp. F158]